MTTKTGLDEETTAALRRRSQEEIETNTYMLQQTYAMKKYLNYLAHESVAANQPSPAMVIRHNLPVNPEPTRTSSRPPTEGVAPPMNITSGTGIRQATEENLQSNRLLACVAPNIIYLNKETQTDKTEFASEIEMLLIHTLRKKNLAPKFVINLLTKDDIEDDDCILISPPTSPTTDEPAPEKSNIDWAQILEFNKINRSIINALYNKSIQTKNQPEKTDKDIVEKSTASTKQDREDFKSRVINIMQELAVDGVIDFNKRKAIEKKRVAPPDETPQAPVVPHKEPRISMRETRIASHARQLEAHNENQMQMFSRLPPQQESNYANYPHQGYRGMNQHSSMPPPRPPPPLPIQYPRLPPPLLMPFARPSTVQDTVTPAHPMQSATTQPAQYRSHMEYHRVPEFDRRQKFHRAREYLCSNELGKQSTSTDNQSTTSYPNAEWSHYNRF